MTVFIWLGIVVLFIIIEAIGPGLVCIWFSVGALVSMIAALIGAPVWLQIALFILVSAAAMAVARPLVKKYVNSKKQPTNADAVIGRECNVLEDIDNINGTGTAKAEGKVWTAKSFSDDVVIPAGTRATVLEIKGVKLVVKPVKNSKEDE